MEENVRNFENLIEPFQSFVCLPKGVRIRNAKKIARHGNQRGFDSIRETNGENEEQTHGYLHKSPNP